jgi:hypothetical protein
MLAGLRYKAIGSALCGLLLLAGAVGAYAATADEYLNQKRLCSASIPDAAALKSNPSAYIGKVIDIHGTVNGIAKSTGSSSFILSCDGQSYLVKASSLPNCVTNGNTVRVLVKVGPGSVACLSDLMLVTAAYEYDVTAREKQLATKPGYRKDPAPGNKAATPTTAKPTQLASRGVSADGEARIREVYGAYRAAIAKFNRRLTPKQVDDITTSLLVFSWNYQVDPRLVVAVVIAESNFNPNATSHAGAMGLGQLMPGTARGLGVGNAYDPVQNLAGSVKLIRGHLDKYGDLALALSAYNAGPGAVKKYGGVPPYRETQNYVAKVSRIYKTLCGK